MRLLLLAGFAMISLLDSFRQASDIAEKERILNQIVREDPHAGRELFETARTTKDDDTRWMAIRGLGYLKYQPAAVFLVSCLQAQHHYVRANAARALGELHFTPAVPALIAVLRSETDGGVLEQTALALQMLKAREAVPAIETALPGPTPQTTCWLLQAVGELGSRKDVPFVAPYLGDAASQPNPVPECAAAAVEKLTGQDFGFDHRLGLRAYPAVPLERARQWWAANRHAWDQR